MKVLLTGASGFLGRHVLECLHRQRIATLAIGRRPPSAGLGADFIAVDLLDAPDLDDICQAAGATHLLHLAWYAEHGQYWTSPLNLRWTDATVRLVEAFCRAGGRQVVVAGTCAEYDWSYGYCREDTTPLNPATLYGAAKDATRRLIVAVCDQAQVPCAWGRIFLPFGDGEAFARLIPSLIAVFRGLREPFGVNADAYRDFLHASEVAEGFMTLCRTEASGAYNISSGQPTQIGELVRALARRYDADPQAVLVLGTNRIGEPPLLVGESLKLRGLGWRPSASLSHWVARYGVPE